MFLKDLPQNTNILEVKIKLTDELLEQYNNYTYKGDGIVYIVGPMMGDFFISNLSKEVKEREIYPMPLTIEPIDLLECEIAK